MGLAIAATLVAPAEIPLPRSDSKIPRIVPICGLRRFGEVTVASPAMQDVVAVLERLSRTEVTITLLGETGTGKDVMARAIHDRSGRTGPFVVFDCGAVPPNLIESELFGHERGAFTGAVNSHAGAFERAREGTLFLDEVGELPVDLQPRLLRALESRSVRRVGGSRDRATDARIVAATNRDLASLVQNQQFRADLYFRLAAAVVSLPPLRERPEDLRLLVPTLLAQLGRAEVTVPEATLAVLRSHNWPGNIRELKNTLACSLAFADSGVLEARHLRLLPAAQDRSALESLPLGGQRLEAIERMAIKLTLQQTGGNKAQAAQLLGIAVSTLYEKLKKYGF
jgi:DNA-binding NtrC family response regulator